MPLIALGCFKKHNSGWDLFEFQSDAELVMINEECKYYLLVINTSCHHLMALVLFFWGGGGFQLSDCGLFSLVAPGCFVWCFFY